MRTLFSDRWFLGGMVWFAAIIVGLQVYGGAYQAEFTGHADEAAHFVSALLVRDYLGQWPLPDPMPWAVQYYLHYPRVAIGQWPPGYYIAQALWWLVFPVSRATALWLNIAMALAVMALFYVLARRIRPGWPVIAAGTLVLCSRVFQEANATVMADLPSLVAALAVLWTLTRLAEEPGGRHLAGIAAALGAALFVKGTGVALLLAPVLLATAGGWWRRLSLGRIVLIAVGAGIPVAGLYLWQYRGSFQTMKNWSGFASQTPWRIDFVPVLAGEGCFVLAIVGLVMAFRRPVAMAAGAVLISMALVSYTVRAMREPRHWIAVVPALLLLSLSGYAWLEKRWPRWAPVAALSVLALFPFAFFRQEPEGFRELAAQLRLPARMLVSSTLGWREGPWIAVVAESEPRPQSTIVRATKVLAETDWNGSRYKLRANNVEAIERSLDETGTDIVVLDKFPAGVSSRALHHFLLQKFLRVTPGWRACAKAMDLEAYCRTLPPRFPRQPLRIDLRSRLGYTIEEQ